MSYTTLDAGKIIETVRSLRQRIEERFPGSGLGGVCRELCALAESTGNVIVSIRKPVIGLRILSGLLVLLILAGVAVTGFELGVPDQPLTIPEFIQVLEAGINDIVLIGLGIFFLITLEKRINRRKVLKALHELRSLAHIVDMHQLTKDPSRLIHAVVDTPASPRRSLPPREVARYLDYCSEMLALTGKIAALFAQDFDDPVVLVSVNEIENLTTSLSRKIWQKLMMLDAGAMEPAVSTAS